MTCEQTIVAASHCVGLTFPGIIDDPGSLAGNIISPIPLLGPEDNILMSFAIFMKETAHPFKAADAFTIASLAARASNLFFADLNLYPVMSEIFSATILEYPLGVLRPVPTAVPPKANSER